MSVVEKDLGRTGDDVGDPDDSDETGQRPPAGGTRDDLSAHRRGADHALETLFTRHAATVRRALRGRVRTSEVDDLVQEVLLRAFERIESFEYRGRGSFAAWLGTLTNSVLVDGHRRASARRRNPGSTVDVDRADGEPACRKTPSRIAMAREWLQRRRERIAALGERDRRIVELRELEGLAFDRIATELGLPSADAARVAYSRLRAKLHERIGDPPS